MLPANLDTALSQHIAQQPAASERMLRKQLIDLPHQLEVGFRDRARPIVEAAATEPKKAYLLLNTPAARSCNRAFHSVIWLGCTSNCCANSASVLSPFKADRATFALKAAV